MKRRILFTIYLKELRVLLRDRQTVLYTVMLPAVLYPAILLGTFQVISYVNGIEERRDSRVAFSASADGFRAFVEERAKEEDSRIAKHVESRSAGQGASSSDADLRAALGVGPGGLTGSQRVDALVDMKSLGSIDGLTISPEQIDVVYSSAQDPSDQARRRVEQLADAWRLERLIAAAESVGASDGFLEPLDVDSQSISTPEEVGSFIAGLILPLLMTMMIAIGAFYPALETTVAEKERGSLETSLLTPHPRSYLVLGKYFAVTTAALISLLLNLIGMSFTLGHLQSQIPVGEISFSIGTIGMVALAALLLSGFLSSIMMVLAFLAKTFKEGQTFLSPVYLLSMLPLLVTSNPDAMLSNATAWVPLINTTLFFRGALQGNLEFAPAAISLFASFVYAALALFLAARILSREDVATGGDVKPALTLWRGLFRRGDMR